MNIYTSTKRVIRGRYSLIKTQKRFSRMGFYSMTHEYDDHMQKNKDHEYLLNQRSWVFNRRVRIKLY